MYWHRWPLWSWRSRAKGSILKSEVFWDRSSPKIPAGMHNSCASPVEGCTAGLSSYFSGPREIVTNRGDRAKGVSHQHDTGALVCYCHFALSTQHQSAQAVLTWDPSVSSYDCEMLRCKCSAFCADAETARGGGWKIALTALRPLACDSLRDTFQTLNASYLSHEKRVQILLSFLGCKLRLIATKNCYLHKVIMQAI